MNRRLVNLVMTDCKNRLFSWHRMDLSKHLFYPSTAEAEAAGGQVDKQGKPPKLGKLRLPPPIMGFEPFPIIPTSDPNPLPLTADRSMFVLLHGQRDRSRILFTSSEGQASSMYDADSRSVIIVPDLIPHTEIGCSDDGMPKAIVTGAGAGEERLYIMRDGGHFELLDFSSVYGDDDEIPDDFITDRSSRPLWQPLPPLPVADANISSFTVVDGGRIICVSFAGSGGNSGTFCFDTVSQEWWPAGDWDLPFEGRAEYVPELETWLGFSSVHTSHYLCTADLSGVAMAPREAPTLQHVWEDYELPLTERAFIILNKDYLSIIIKKTVYWSMPKLFLVNLGSGRLCVAKVVHREKSVKVMGSLDRYNETMGTLTVLTGVEVIRDGGDGELRMVKHKSRQLLHPGFDVACVL